MFIKNKKLYNIKKENKIRIDHDIKELDSLPKGIYTKTKYNENEEAYLIKIMVDKNAISYTIFIFLGMFNSLVFITLL